MSTVPCGCGASAALAGVTAPVLSLQAASNATAGMAAREERTVLREMERVMRITCLPFECAMPKQPKARVGTN
ncbi:hypothetical protein [Pseudaminobacter soli (ex Li et al. 2025)]|uniref:hypothetical protein n=1 Tax=Pseudaminobacter soli (ex Li et al. 2025) TaxID=1295366 RepID=UPI001FE0E67A|nr:hypothetical protein [Mesorhizobium soli]